MNRFIVLIATTAALTACGTPEDQASSLHSDSFTRLVQADTFTALMLFGQLKAAGVVDTHVVTGGETYRAKSVFCWQPVVPNPQTECQIDQVDDASLKVRGELANNLRHSLDVLGAAYVDGSVGAAKWRADDVECTRLVTPSVSPMCEMLLSTDVPEKSFSGDDAAKVFDILKFVGIPATITPIFTERVALSKVSCSRPVVPNAVSTCEYRTLDDRLFTKTGPSSARLLDLLRKNGANPPGFAVGATSAIAVDLTCVQSTEAAGATSCTFKPESL